MTNKIKRLFVLGSVVSGLFVALTACDINQKSNSQNNTSSSIPSSSQVSSSSSSSYESSSNESSS